MYWIIVLQPYWPRGLAVIAPVFMRRYVRYVTWKKPQCMWIYPQLRTKHPKSASDVCSGVAWQLRNNTSLQAIIRLGMRIGVSHLIAIWCRFQTSSATRSMSPNLLHRYIDVKKILYVIDPFSQQCLEESPVTPQLPSRKWTSSFAIFAVHSCGSSNSFLLCWCLSAALLPWPGTGTTHFFVSKRETCIKTKRKPNTWHEMNNEWLKSDCITLDEHGPESTKSLKFLPVKV